MARRTLENSLSTPNLYILRSYPLRVCVRACACTLLEDVGPFGVVQSSCSFVERRPSASKCKLVSLLGGRELAVMHKAHPQDRGKMNCSYPYISNTH